MDPTTRDVLKRLGVGEAIGSVCRDTGWSRAGFEAWWQHETASRAPRCHGEVPAPVSGAVSIERDRWGIPHIVDQRRADLSLGFGYAMAQDRLFQMASLGMVPTARVRRRRPDRRPTPVANADQGTGCDNALRVSDRSGARASRIGTWWSRAGASAAP